MESSPSWAVVFGFIESAPRSEKSGKPYATGEGPTPPPPRPLFSTLLGRRTGDSSQWFRPLPPPQPLVVVPGLLLPPLPHEWRNSTAVSTPTFAFCVSCPKAHKVLGYMSHKWEHTLNKFVVHSLRLLNEPLNGNGEAFDETTYATGEGPTPPPPRPSFSTLFHRRAGDLNQWFPPLPPPQPLVVVPGLLLLLRLLPPLPREWRNSTAASTRTFAFCVSCPKAYTVLGHMSREWEHTLNKFVVHSLRLLNEPPNGKDEVFDERIGDAVSYDNSSLWASFTFENKREFQRHEWMSHGDKQSIFSQSTYFYNIRKLIEYYRAHAGLETVKQRVRSNSFHKDGLYWQEARAETIRDYFKQLCNGCSPQLVCRRHQDGSKDGYLVLYEVIFHLNSRLEQLSVPDGECYIGVEKDDLIRL